MHYLVRFATALLATAAPFGALAPAVTAQTPFVSTAAIRRNGNFSCNGVLINSRTVLTAASAVDGALTATLSVEVGNGGQLGSVTSIPVASYKIHEFYGIGPASPSSLNNNIALVYLAWDVAQNANTQYATLAPPTGNNYVGMTATLQYWRSTCAGTLNKACQSEQLAVISTAEANFMFAGILGVNLTDDQLAVQDPVYTVALENSAMGAGYYVGVGGNLVLIGIQGFGNQTSPFGCASPNLPQLGTRLTAQMVNWVVTNLGQGGGSPPALLSYGVGTPGCAGASILTGSPLPQVNTPTFTLTSTNAPPTSLGLVLITNVADVDGSDPLGIGVLFHVDPFASTAPIALNATSNSSGLGSAPAPIPNHPSLIGATVYAQTIWAWPLNVCNNVPFGLASSNGLAITIH